MQTHNIELSIDEYKEIATGPLKNIAIESCNTSGYSIFYVVILDAKPDSSFYGHRIDSLTNINLDNDEILYAKGGGIKSMAIVSY